MPIDKRKLHSFFYSSGYKYLYHCNTIATSCLFIKQGGLLSKRQIEKRKLNNTSCIDKEINQSNDISFDTSDFKRFYGKLNHHGPVCFVMSIDILLDSKFPDIYVDTIHHNNTDKRIHTSEFDIENQCTQIKMLSFKNCNDIIPFNPYLNKIVVDWPKTYDMDINTLIENGIKSLKNCIDSNNMFSLANYYKYIMKPNNYNINLFFSPN